MKVNLYSTKLTKTGSFALPKEFSGEINEPLLAQAIHVYRDRQHPGNSKVQTRSAVSLTKSKWYRQKGTGRARHGSKNAPIFVGGGVAHGPKGVKRVLALPTKMKRSALLSAFALKAKNKKLAATRDLSVIKKTKDAQGLVDAIREGEKTKKITIALAAKNKDAFQFFKNIADVKTVAYSDLNAYKVYLAGALVVDTDAFVKAKKETKK
jgi:large subunit ribosomal protein L4